LATTWPTPFGAALCYNSEIPLAHHLPLAGQPKAGVMSDSNSSPETGIQAHRAASHSETAIQARLGDGPLPPGLQEPAFLARLKTLLDLHQQARASRPKPPMWGMIQGGAVLLAIVVSFGVFNTMMAGGQGGEDDLAGVAFVVTFVLICLLPELLLWAARRSQRAVAMQGIWDNAESLLRTFGDEVEHCGGVQILGDCVELEALVQVLEQRFHATRSRGWPGP